MFGHRQLFKSPLPLLLAYLLGSLAAAIYLSVVGWRPVRWYEWGLVVLLAPGAWLAAHAIGEALFSALLWILGKIPGLGHAMRSNARWAPWVRVPILACVCFGLLMLAIIYGKPLPL